MGNAELIDINMFKVVNRAIAQSDNLETMSTHLTQLLVGALEIMGCSIFMLNPDTKELEIVASFGLSLNYLNKGPVKSGRSIRRTAAGKPVVIADTTNTDALQYPEDARAEGIRAIVSLPIKFYGKVIGELRLYHHRVWNISDADLDSLHLLSDNIALAMTYTRLLNALQAIQETVSEVHGVWLHGGV